SPQAGRGSANVGATSPLLLAVLRLDRAIGGALAALPGRGVVVDAHLEHEVGRRAEADILELVDVRRVGRESLADVVVTAEMFGGTGRAVAPLHRSRQALVELAGAHALVELLAAGQPADFH